MFVMDFEQGCILLTYLSVISSKFIQKFAQKCQYFTLIDQSVPPDNFYVTCLLREKSALILNDCDKLWMNITVLYKKVYKISFLYLKWQFSGWQE